MLVTRYASSFLVLFVIWKENYQYVFRGKIMNKVITSIILGAFTLIGCAQSNPSKNKDTAKQMSDSAIVYMTKEISPDAIIKLL